MQSSTLQTSTIYGVSMTKIFRQSLRQKTLSSTSLASNDIRKMLTLVQSLFNAKFLYSGMWALEQFHQFVYNFQLVKRMLRDRIRRFIFSLLLLIACSHAAIIGDSLSSSVNNTDQPRSTAFFTIVTSLTDLSSQNSIFSQLGVPGFSRKHGYNYIALDGWSCSQKLGPVISFWQSPNTYLNDSLAANDSTTRKIIKQFYQSAGIKVLVNAFGTYENPATNNQNAFNCSNKLISFIQQNDLDGVNVDFQDLASLQTMTGINWLTEFSLGLNQGKQDFMVTHTVDSRIFDASKYLQGDYSILQKIAGKNIQFYNIRYHNPKGDFQEIFGKGSTSLPSISRRGIPINKLVVGKPSIFNATGFIRPSKLINFYRKANAELNWWGGAMFQPYIPRQAEDQTRLVTLRRDNIQVISAVNLDSINYWWPPEKTVADIGVPGYAPNNMYNTFIFGTWTCKSGAFDVSKLWSEASFYLSNKFGNTSAAIQSYLKNKYESKGKNILVRAFGTAQSPTSARLDPSVCARGLASFIKTNNFDGVDVGYQDNDAFNNGIAENWLISFTYALRNLLPFHIISHSIQGYLLDRTKYRGGSYTRVISNVGNVLDFYSIVYYGQQHTEFTTYESLFIDSGAEFPNISVTQLISQGFDITKIVIAKPVRLYDAQGMGFIAPLQLRKIFLQANEKLGWKAGITYSSYINDQNGQSLLWLLRGMNRTDSIRFTYVNNVNVWWPPQSTLGQMGAPSLAAPNIYNFFAYAFWTCKGGPKDITKLYNDPITYLGTELGQTKADIQSYIKGLYSKASVKLFISAFGATEFPAHDGLDAVKCGASLADFLSNNLLDGVDIDFEDSQSFTNGTGEEWVNTFTRQLRRLKPFNIVSHAPQGPYFNAKFSQTGSYITIDNVSGKFIDFYNIQFYNQGNETSYDTYQKLFVDSGLHNPNTSLFQIIHQGIEPQKVVLGKPVTQKDAYNTGFVNSTALKDLLKQAVNDKANPGWKPSLMYWQYLSDLSGSAISEAMSYNS